jgi:single-stranded-DNA-specific exonuclease
VQKGLKQLQNTSRLGLQELYKIKEINPSEINETHISFILAPMLNSLGRLDDANPIVDFLTTTNQQLVNTFATQLNNLNEKRKLLTEQITEAVLDQLGRNPSLIQFSGIVIHQNYWHPGILGIVANRIVEQFQKPVILLTGNEKQGLRGSARSIESVNIIEAIREQHILLDHFGGHAMAAGLSMQAKNLDKFRSGLHKSIQKQTGSEITENVFMYDCEMDFKEITPQFIDQFLTLQPFGAGNPPFLFFSKAVNVLKISKIGKTQQHVRLHLTNQIGEKIEVLWWRGDTATLPNEEIDILYTLNKPIYKGQERIQIELINFRPSSLTIHKNKHVLENLIIHDFRTKKQALSLPNKEFPDAAIWYEGVQKLDTSTYTRLTIGPTNNLLIAFSPPGLNDIRKVVQTCRPKQIILYPPQNPPLSRNDLLTAVGRMINYAIQNKQGLMEIEKMAAAIGQRKITIQTILEYLDAAGKITLSQHPDTDILVKHGGIKKPDLEIYLLEQFNFLHKETRAFQSWYLTVDGNKLKEEVFQI